MEQEVPQWAKDEIDAQCSDAKKIPDIKIELESLETKLEGFADTKVEQSTDNHERLERALMAFGLFCFSG